LADTKQEPDASDLLIALSARHVRSLTTSEALLPLLVQRHAALLIDQAIAGKSLTLRLPGSVDVLELTMKDLERLLGKPPVAIRHLSRHE
jgi:hypothetical protein